MDFPEVTFPTLMLYYPPTDVMNVALLSGQNAQ